MKNELIKEIRNHKVPAQATLEYMGETNNKFNNFNIMVNDIQNDIKTINKTLEENTCEHREIMKALKDLSEKLDKKYSAKWVERTFVAILGAVGLSVLYALLNLILN